MIKVIRSALLVAVIYFAGSYYFDQPEEIKKDAVALREMAKALPEPEQVFATVRATTERPEQRGSRAKQPPGPGRGATDRDRVPIKPPCSYWGCRRRHRHDQIDAAAMSRSAAASSGSKPTGPS